MHFPLTRPPARIPSFILQTLTLVSGIAAVVGVIPAAAPVALLVGTIAHGFSAYFAPNLPPTPPSSPTP